MRKIAQIGLVVLLGGLTGCQSSDSTAGLVARVGTAQLTWDELNEVVPDDAAPEDSVMLAERYIQSWIREQVILSEAEQTLPEEKRNFDELIANYRKTLLKYTYEQEWVNQKLDTVVTETEIESYYQQNIQNFQLKDYIVKVKFCAISTDTEPKKVKALKKLFYSSDPQDLTAWISMCVSIGASHYFEEDKWLLWDEFVNQIPLKVYDREAFLRSNKEVEFAKDNNLYLILITDYQLSGSQSPLSFEREKIRDMIINKRKLDLINRMREDLYNKAIADNEVETFYVKQ